MEGYGEIVVLQSCWMMISFLFQNLKKYHVVTKVCCWDDVFGPKTYSRKPYPQRGKTDEKRAYNYHHCRARRKSEKLFGIISNRWGVLRAPILLPPKSVRNFAMAILALHNHLRQSSSHRTHCLPGLSDV